MYGKSAYSRHHRHRTRLVVSKAQCIQPAKDLLQRSWRLSCGTAENGPSPLFTLDLLPLPEKQSIFYIFDLDEDVHETLRISSTLCYYSSRPLFLVEYNAKRMQNRGDDIISFGKYHGHYLHEILQVDPGYLTWIAFKFTPRIPKQERFAQIARIYHSVYIDILQRKPNNRLSDAISAKREKK